MGCTTSKRKSYDIRVRKSQSWDTGDTNIEDGLNDKIQINQEYKDHLERLKKLGKSFVSNHDTKNNLSNKDLALICGITGVGKSTYLNYLNGLKFVKLAGENMIKLQQPGRCIAEIGYNFDSTTLNINYFKKSNLHICDTPGFSDSKGFEGDLINSISTMNSIKNARSIRFILIFTPTLYSKDGRAAQFKELCLQYIKIFHQYQDYLESIILVFNRIKKSEEEKNINSAILDFEAIKRSLNSQDEKLFQDMLIQKLKVKDYIIFDPLQDQDYKDHLQKINKLTPLDKEKINSYIKFSLPQKSENEFSNFLLQSKDILKYYLKNSYPEQVLEIVTSFSQLYEHVDLKIVKELFRKVLEEVEEQENIVQFCECFNSFTTLEIYNESHCKFVIEKMKQVLKYYYIVEQIKKITKQELKIKNTIYQIISYIQDKFEEIIYLSQKNLSFEIKYYHTKKLKIILSNKKLQNDFKYICDQFQLQNNIILQNIFKNENYDSALQDLQQSCQKLSDEIKNIIDNQIITDEVKIILKNIKLLNENEQNELNLNNLSYQEIQQKIISQIKILNYNINQIKGNDESVQQINLRKQIEKSYKFIKFICSAQNTENHFQNNCVQSEFKNLKETIKKCLIELYKQGKEMKQLDDINQIKDQLLIFQRLDGEISQEANQSDSNFNNYEIQINQLYSKQKKLIEQNYLSICNKIKYFIENENENQQDLNEALFNEIKKYIIDLLKLKKIISEILIGQQQNYDDFEKENISYFTDVEQIISQQINDNNKLTQNFQYIQILIAIQTGYSEQNISYKTPIIQIQKTQIQFLQQLNKWINNIIDLQVFSKSQNFNLDDLEDVNKRMQNIKIYQSFLLNFKKNCVNKIQIIYAKIIQINAKYKYQEFLQDADRLMPQKPQNIQSLYDISNIDQVEKQIQKVNIYLQELKQLFNRRFKDTYNFDLDNMNDLVNKDILQIKIILDKLKNLWLDKYIHEIYPVNENKYKEAQDIMKTFLYQELHNIQQLGANQIEERKIKIMKLKKKYSDINQHIHSDLIIDLEKEKLKIDADQKKLNQQLTSLLNEDKYSEISEFIKTLDQTEQQKFQTALECRVIQIKTVIKDTVEIFNKAPSHELQSRIFQYYSNFNEAQKYFNTLIKEFHQTQVEQVINIFINNILEEIFISLQKRSNIQENRQENYESESHRKIMCIAAAFFQNLKQLQKDQLQVFNVFQIKIKENINQVQASLQSSQIDFNIIHQNMNIVIKICKITEDLEFSQKMKDINEIQNKKSKMYQLFNQAILKEIEKFIHNSLSFDADQIDQQMRDSFQKIWNFFEVEPKDQVKIIYNFIKDKQKTINNLKQMIQTKSTFRIKNIIRQYQFSKLINNEIKKLIEQISNTIICESFPQKNFKNVKKQLTKLRKIFFFYQDQIDILNIKNCINAVFANVSSQILSLWNQLENQNLKQPHTMLSTLHLIDKLLFITRDYQIDDFMQEDCNDQKLINIIKDSFQNKTEEIKSCIKIMDYGTFIIHYQELLAAFKVYIPFHGKNRNYLMVFDKIMKVYTQTNQLKEMKKNYELIKQFEQLKDLFTKLIEDFQQELLNSFKVWYEHKQFQKIYDIQLKFLQFSEKINEVESFSIKNKFIFDWILNEYNKCYEQAEIIGRSEQIQLQQLRIFSQSLIEIEQWFQDYIKQMKTKNYSNQIKIIIAKQVKIVIKNTESLIINFAKEQNRKEFVENIIQIFIGSIELGVTELLHIEFRNIILKAIENQDMDVVIDLLYHLNQDTVRCRIQDEYSDIFKQWFIQLYNEKTANQNSFGFIKDKLKTQQADGDIKFSVDQLFKQYQSYRCVYDEINQQIAQAKHDKTSLTKSILQKAEKFKKNNNQLTDQKIIWNKEQKKQLIEILGEVSAIWSIIDRQENNSKNTRFIHTIQIIIIIRMLNIDIEQSSQVFNHIAQIRTGEGKSIALGITSTIFALIGFQVDCCCYSQYLSDRDYKDFESFFINFSVEKAVQYNTFYKLTEKIINSPNDLRTLGENYFTNNQQQMQKQNQSQVKKILIIDEIDFFFGENFLGEVYAVGFQYTTQEVVNLMKMIWKKRFRNITIDTIQNSIEYQNLFQKNSQLNQMKKFINKKIEQMIKESKDMEKHYYLLDRIPNSIERRIGYKEIDRISYDTVKGYKTSYAYMQEWQRKKITSQQLYKELAFNFNLGCFSYPKIIEDYSLVLGVTGTLENMTDFQKLKMKDLCKIQKQTIAPTIFGESKFVFDKTKDAIFLIQERNISNKYFHKSVIIFFENQKVLFEYKRYSEENHVSDIQLLFEQTADKKAVIAKAAYSKVITLLTKPFGRGTDFKCYDKDLLKCGGIHAIQTFLSDTLAEEIQIQGRVARNGEPGSYSLIIFQLDLENQFKIKDKFIPEKAKQYKYLNNIRKEYMKIQDKILEEKQKVSEIYHKKSVQLKNLLNQKSQQINQINQLLDEIAQYGDTKDNKINKPNQYLNNIDLQDLQNAKKDKYNNPIDDRFGLGKNGQFKDLSILIGQFCSADGCDVTRDIQNELKSSLKQKGFKQFEIATDEKSFVQKCDKFDQIWIISGSMFINSENNIEKDFVNSILKHLKLRKGLLIFADNQPYVYHANLILKSIPIGYEEQNPVYMELEGNHRACNILKKGIFNQTLQFGEHPITQGLNQIYEGNTICYPKILNGQQSDSYDDFLDIEIIGTSQTNKPCMFVLNGNNIRGRIVFDCGFTKIMSQHWDNTVETAGYIQNCYAWLYFMDKDEQ